jgi:uncharacterized protein involved in outer membrane biogenesis
MGKKIAFIFLLLLACIAAGLFYLNHFVLPVRLKAFVIAKLEQETKAKVGLEAISINIFKGLALKNLSLSQGSSTLLNIREASCSFLIPPLFKKTLIIPQIKIKSAALYLERKSDGTLNLAGLLPAQGSRRQQPGLKVVLGGISLSDSSLHFQDYAVTPAFARSLEKINARCRLFFPASVKFDFRCGLSGSAAALNGKGEYRLAEKALEGQINLQRLAPKEFLPYLKQQGWQLQDGLVEAALQFRLQEGVFSAPFNLGIANLSFAKGESSGRFNSRAEGKFVYRLRERQMDFSGRAEVYDALVYGVPGVGEISNIKGELQFDPSGINGKGISAAVLGLPFRIDLSLRNFSAARLALKASAPLDLPANQKQLEEKFRFSLPLKLRGSGELSLNIDAAFPAKGPPQFNGSLGLDSPELKFSAEFLAKEKKFTFPKLSAAYLDSRLAGAGAADFSRREAPGAQIDADVDLNLADIARAMLRPNAALQKLDPQGRLQVKLNVAADPAQAKSLLVQAKAASPEVSLYGLRLRQLGLECRQQAGSVEIPLLEAEFYGGAVQAQAKIDFSAAQPAFGLALRADGVKIEELKNDTPLKKQDIAGLIRLQAQINSPLREPKLMQGGGWLAVSQGRLWQLDFFKGIGSLIFVQDFSQIIFREGRCDFYINDGYIATDKLLLKSDIINLSGPLKIGFDHSLQGALKVEVLSDKIPLSGTYRDIATTIIGQNQMFGEIKLSGTLKEPKFRFQPAVADIVKGLKDFILGNLKNS